MPNWCHCTLTVTGESETLARFVSEVRESETQPLSFSKHVPEPEGEYDWWEWHIGNWGCKWDASFSGPFMALGAGSADVAATVEAQGATITPTVAVYKFDTPWSPPAEYVERVSELFPELTFTLTFGEPGEGYAGLATWCGGLLVEEEQLDVEDVLMPEEMWF